MLKLTKKGRGGKKREGKAVEEKNRYFAYPKYKLVTLTLKVEILA